MQVQERLEKQLKFMFAEKTTLLEDVGDTEFIERITVEVTGVRLNYLQIYKGSGSEEQYLLPVWEVTAERRIRFADDYPTGSSDTYLLDENMEMFDWSQPDPMDEIIPTILTINAIDGTVVPRSRNY